MNNKSLLYGLSGFLFLSIQDALIKYGYTLTNAYTQIPTLVTILMLVFVYSIRKFGIIKPVKLQKKHVIPIILFGILNGIGNICMFFAFQNLPLEEIYPIALLTPFIFTFISLKINKEQPNHKNYLGLLGGLLGAYCIIEPSYNTLVFAHFIVLITVFSNSIRDVIVYTFKDIDKAHLILSSQVVFLIITYVLYGIPNITKYNVNYNFLLLMLLIAATFSIGFLLNLKGITLGRPEFMGFARYSQIIYGSIISYYFFSGDIKLLDLIGIGIIVLSALSLLKKKAR